LFDEAPKIVVERVEQVVRLIRSKGVGVYFVTQNPLDVPETILAQLGNRVQHALRAYTPREQKAVRSAAETFRPNPDFDCSAAITRLGVGEALVSTLEENGVPSMVQRTLIRPPASRLGPVTPQERQQTLAQSPVSGQYDRTVDRDSAFEMLQKKARESADVAERRQQQAAPKTDSGGSGWSIPGFGTGGGSSGRQSVTEAAVKSVVRSVGSQLGRALVRGILGSLTRR
jgi:DNA helicase HerA-like ATPase